MLKGFVDDLSINKTLQLKLNRVRCPKKSRYLPMIPFSIAVYTNLRLEIDNWTQFVIYRAAAESPSHSSILCLKFRLQTLSKT
jgi:hypothetical protein